MRLARPPASANLPLGVAIVSATSTDQTALTLLLRIEQMARRATNLAELQHLAANETRKLNRARQIFVVGALASKSPSVLAVSGVGAVDASSMLVVSIADVTRRLVREGRASAPLEFALPAFCVPASDLATTYPFRDVLWMPLLDRAGIAFAGLLMTRDVVWSEADIAVSTRLAETYAHAWRELAQIRYKYARITRPRLLTCAAVLAAAAMMALPIPMTALAPAEVVAANPMIVSSPIDGVVDRIDVDPGQVVKVGDVLVRLSDTMLRNKVEIARRDVAVSEARTKQASILAMTDVRGRHELGIAEADLELKRAELAFATDMLKRTVITAARGGVAAYADRRSLIGRPVATGERIMEIAEPTAAEVRIDVAVADAIALVPSGRVKVFLDIDPLNPRDAQIVRSDYKARPGDNDVLAFKTFAVFRDEASAPRIGVRGTAQIYGERTALGLFLFRRPIASARQYLGL